MSKRNVVKLSDRMRKFPNKKNTRNKTPQFDTDAEAIIISFDEATRVFQEETERLKEGDIEAVESFSERKREVQQNLKRSVNEYIRLKGTIDPGSPTALKIAERMETMKKAADRNAMALQTAAEAMNYVSHLYKQAVTKGKSEGMYERSGRKVESFDRSALDLNERI